jgi:hypothetical protein
LIIAVTVREQSQEAIIGMLEDACRHLREDEE